MAHIEVATRQEMGVGLIGERMDMMVGTPVGTSAADRFFDREQGLVSVWDFDYDAIIDFETSFNWAVFAFTPPLWLSSLCCYPCYLKKNVEWRARAQHVALTVDGIRYVTEKHPTCCGLSFTDRGKESKTVPYDKITDCDVQEPAGTACCCCVPNVLTRVHVDTASSGSKDGILMHELSLKGLKNANEFKQAVWAMKRGQLPSGTIAPVSHPSQPPLQAAMSTVLLTEIRDELRQLNTKFPMSQREEGNSSISKVDAPVEEAGQGHEEIPANV